MRGIAGKSRKGKKLGAITGAILSVFGKKRDLSIKDLEHAEFRTGTARMGVRFSEKIRNTFRGRWFRKI